MPCIPALTLSPPDLSVYLPSLSFSTPTITLGVTLCCQIELPPLPTITVALGTVVGVAATLAPLFAAIMGAIDTINGLLDQLQVSCPLE